MEGVGAQAAENGGAGVGSDVQARQSQRLADFLQSVNVKYVKLGYHYLMKYLVTLSLVPLENNLVSVAICSALLVLGATIYFMTRPRSVYLVDFSYYLPPLDLRVNFKDFMEHSRLIGDFSAQVPTQDLQALRNGLRLVVNCSLFNPTPSLSAMIINKYKLRGNIRSFNLGKTECSAGVIAIDLAKDML
uniref:FAE domain-containing protein n=1 Tax=Nelumbo nucifera TaxID=4432 RepID=A0A822Z0K5_NELNU|nr:TPA_asm: hypothetical protein HUJ06_007177 [Nelumbo nucifera]